MNVPPKHPLTFNGLHSVISQKILIIITTAVRTSNLTYRNLSFRKYCTEKSNIKHKRTIIILFVPSVLRKNQIIFWKCIRVNTLRTAAELLTPVLLIKISLFMALLVRSLDILSNAPEKT
jgi:hypothetical protein